MTVGQGPTELAVGAGEWISIILPIVLFFLLISGMDELRFYVLFNSISVISGQCSDDNERLCAMKLRLRLRRFHLE